MMRQADNGTINVGFYCKFRETKDFSIQEVQYVRHFPSFSVAFICLFIYLNFNYDSQLLSFNSISLSL